MTEWVFSRLSGSAVRRDPNETQLFKAEQADEGEYAGTDALVREILQNSMDASLNGSPVRVRLALHPAHDLPARDRLALYFSRLQAPLAHRDIEFDADGVPLLQTGFLICEDFGTRGLGGDPFLARDPEPGSLDRQDFFWFWRNIGRSGKTGEDLGRWGLGKTVYRAASQVGCMLGLTVRDVDSKQLLMGQAVLKIHDHDGVEYVPEGYWCAGCNQSDLPLPIEDSAELDQFRSEWKLQRTNEPGLSVVVPYVTVDLQAERILQAVCVHFFLPILRGNLVVEIDAPDLGSKRLDQHSLASIVDSLKWTGPKRAKRNAPPPIEFIKKCLKFESQASSTNLLGKIKLPELNDEAFEPEVLTQLRDELASEELLSIKVRVSLPRKRSADQVGELIVFLQRRPDGQAVDSYYTREGMTITKLNSRAGARGIQAFVTVEQGPLATLLGDSEGPAHEDWESSAELPDRFWKNWKGRIKFCRRIVDNLVELLAPPSTKADYELLSDFFSIERLQSPESRRVPNKQGEGEPDFKSIQATPRWYRLEGRRGGFRVTSTNQEPVPQGARLTVSVAYDLPSGNPLRKWSPFDFEFRTNGQGKIRFSGEGLAVKKLSGNSLLLRNFGEAFDFKAEGFDEYRDLYVRVDEDDGRSVQEDNES